MKIYLSSMKQETIMCFKTSVTKFKKVIKLHLLVHLVVESQQYCNLFNVSTSQKRVELQLMELILKIMTFIIFVQVWELLVNNQLCLMEALSITFNTIFQIFQCKKSLKLLEVQMLFHLLWERKNFNKLNQRKNQRKLAMIQIIKMLKPQVKVKLDLTEV